MQKIFQNFVDILTKKYCCFNGRANRAEFWYFFLCYTVIMGLLGWLLSYLKTAGNVIYCILALGLLLPYLGVGARRLHDIGKSGWFMLICLIPLVGAIILLVKWAQEGDRADNQYGPVSNDNATPIAPQTPIQN